MQWRQVNDVFPLKSLKKCFKERERERERKRERERERKRESRVTVKSRHIRWPHGGVFSHVKTFSP